MYMVHFIQNSLAGGFWDEHPLRVLHSTDNLLGALRRATYLLGQEWVDGVRVIELDSYGELNEFSITCLKEGSW
jgi:hypothetical protein